MNSISMLLSADTQRLSDVSADTQRPSEVSADELCRNVHGFSLNQRKYLEKMFFWLECLSFKSTKIQIKSRKQKVDNPTYQSADRPCDYCPVDIVVDCIDVVVVQIQSWCVAVLHSQVQLADLYRNLKNKEIDRIMYELMDWWMNEFMHWWMDRQIDK